MTGRELKPYESALAKAADDFAKTADGLNYDREKIFAMQALMKNEFSMATANKNPLSVRLAMLNVAATGLTLNPAYGYAFLVPRDGAIVLDISYKGLLKIATDTGSIVWGRADVVYEADDFESAPIASPRRATAIFFATLSAGKNWRKSGVSPTCTPGRSPALGWNGFRKCAVRPLLSGHKKLGRVRIALRGFWMLSKSPTPPKGAIRSTPRPWRRLTTPKPPASKNG
jgi:hypothetical protein